MTNQELANVFEEYERFSKELSDKPMVTFKDNFMMVKKHEDFFKSVYKIGYIQGYKDQRLFKRLSRWLTKVFRKNENTI